MKKLTLGVDIGGTKIQLGLVSDTNRIVSSQQFPIKARSKQAALRRITDVIEPHITSSVRAIGIGITGLVDVKTGMVVGSANLPRDWHNVPLSQLLKKKFKKPVTVDNDAHGSALAEALVGKGKKEHSVLTITLGTGVGAGLVIDKQLFRSGLNSIEFGHTIIADTSPRCSCGRYGHFEALVSGRAMQALYRSATKTTKTTHEIVAEAKAGKRPAKQVLQQMSQSLATGLANAIRAYSPNMIVLGGGLAAVPQLVRPALKLLPPKLPPFEYKNTKIIVSSLGYDAGVLGAALLTKSKP